MYLKPYFYYRQQYPELSKSNDDNVDSKENDGQKAILEESSVSQSSGQESCAEPVENDRLEPKLSFEHSRFQEVAPGVFQFKHPRPHTIPQPSAPLVNLNAPEFLAGSSHPDRKPEVDGFIKVGTFPGAVDYGLPVYQFT